MTQSPYYLTVTLDHVFSSTSRCPSLGAAEVSRLGVVRPQEYVEAAASAVAMSGLEAR